MIIESVRAKNWRIHENFFTTFSPRSNHICGINNKGKTSLIKGILWNLYPIRGGEVSVHPDRDIHDGGEMGEFETVFSITRGSPDGATTQSERHQILRRLGKKTKDNVFIFDDKPVKLEEALNIMTEKLGLPHPDQLRGLIHLGQMRLDGLVRQNPKEREAQFFDLLGYHALEPVQKSLAKKIEQLNALANSERSLGVSTTELDSEVESLTVQLEKLRKEASEMPSESDLAIIKEHLEKWVSHQQYLKVLQDANAEKAKVPSMLIGWYEKLKASILSSQKTPPSLDTLASIGRLRSSIESSETEVGKIASDAAIEAERSSIKRWIAEQKCKLASGSVDRAMVPLPPFLREWARNVRSMLADTRGKDAEARKEETKKRNLRRAAVLVRDNENALTVSRQNGVIRSLTEALNAIKGANCPDTELLKLYTDLLSLEAQCKTSAKELGVRKHPDVGVIEEALRNRDYLQLHSSLPKQSSSGGVGTSPWSSKHDASLRDLWAVIEADESIVKCPLTGDAIDRELIASCKKDVIARQTALLASKAWQDFSKLARCSVPAIADMIDKGRIAEAMTTIENAVKAFHAACSQCDIAPTSVFWTDEKRRSPYLSTLQQRGAVNLRLGSKKAEICGWIDAQCATLQVEPAVLFQNLFSLEKQLEQKGKIQELSCVPFAAEDGEKLETLEDLILAEDTALAAFDAFPQASGASPAVKFDSIAQAELKISDLDTALTNRSNLISGISHNRKVLDELTANISSFDEFSDLCKALAPSSSEDIKAFDKALNPSRDIFKRMSDLSAAAEFSWNAELGEVPVSIVTAQARITSVDNQKVRAAELRGSIAELDRNLKRNSNLVITTRNRATRVAEMDSTINRFKYVDRFLQPEQGPRILMSQQFIEVVSRANEVLQMVGAGILLNGDQDFELLEVKEGKLFQQLMSETGGGMGNASGIAIALALADYYNDVSGRTQIQTLFLDEPSICVDKPLLPSLMHAITTGRRLGHQTIIIEHDPSGSSYCDKVINLN